MAVLEIIHGPLLEHIDDPGLPFSKVRNQWNVLTLVRAAATRSWACPESGDLDLAAGFGAATDAIMHSILRGTTDSGRRSSPLLVDGELAHHLARVFPIRTNGVRRL